MGKLELQLVPTRWELTTTVETSFPSYCRLGVAENEASIMLEHVKSQSTATHEVEDVRAAEAAPWTLTESSGHLHTTSESTSWVNAAQWLKD